MYASNRTRHGHVVKRAAMVRTHPLNRGRVAWWLALPGLNGGGTWADIAGHNTGTLNSCTWRPTSRPGALTSLGLNGTSSYAMAPDSPSLRPPNQLSVSAWVSMTAINSLNTVVCKNYSAAPWSSPFLSYFLRIRAGILEFGLNLGGSFTEITPSFTWATNTWYHLVAIYDSVHNGGSVGLLAAYVNGVSIGSEFTSPFMAVGYSSEPLTIGADNSATPRGDYVTGAIDDVSVWNRVLTDAEILQLYNLSRLGYPGVLARENQSLEAALWPASGGTVITVSFALLSQSSSLLANINATLGITLQSASQNATSQLDINETLGVRLQSASQNATASFNINTTLGVTLGAISGNSSILVNINDTLGVSFSAVSTNSLTSLNINDTLGASFVALSDDATTQLNVIAIAGIGCTLAAASQDAAVSINANAILQTTFIAAAQAASTSFNTNSTLQTTFTAVSQSSSTSINTTASLQTNLAAASQPATALLNALAGTGTQAVIASTIERVFSPFVNLLINNLPSVFNTSNCIVSIRDEIPEAPGSPFCWVFPGSFDELTAQVSGSGLYVSGVNGIFTVRLRLRNIMDAAYTETQALLNANSSLGMYALVLQIINVLHLCFPLDTNGNFLCEEPPKLISISEPMRVPNAREWIGIDINFHTSLYMKTSVT